MTALETWITGEILGCLGDRAEWANENRDAIDIELSDDDFARLTINYPDGGDGACFVVVLSGITGVLDLDGATSLIEASDMVAERLPATLEKIARTARTRSRYMAELSACLLAACDEDEDPLAAVAQEVIDAAKDWLDELSIGEHPDYTSETGWALDLTQTLDPMTGLSWAQPEFTRSGQLLSLSVGPHKSTIDLSRLANTTAAPTGAAVVLIRLLVGQMATGFYDAAIRQAAAERWKIGTPEGIAFELDSGLPGVRERWSVEWDPDEDAFCGTDWLDERFCLRSTPTGFHVISSVEGP